MTSRMRDYGVKPFWERRPDVRFCGHQKPQSINGLEPWVATQPHHTSPCEAISIGHAFSDPGGTGDQQNPVDLPLRLDDASASPTTPQGLHREQLI